MAKWFGTHYNLEVRFSRAVKCNKGPYVLHCLIKEKIIIIIIITIIKQRVFFAGAGGIPWI